MKKILQRLSVLLLAAFMAVCCFSCAFLKQPKTFSKAGASITLTESFVEKELVSQTAYFESANMIVTMLKEEFSMMPGLGSITEEEYARLAIQINGMDVPYATSEDGYAYFEFQKTISGNDYSYYATCFKANDAFWLIQFGCFTKNYEKMKPEMQKYAKSVVFEGDSDVV